MTGFEFGADPNWLLSALAQSSAALIAIVGGLLVSRYVTLHAEQQAAERRVNDLVRRQSVAAEALAEAETRLAQHRVDEVLDDHDVFEAIMQAVFKADPETVLRAVDQSGRDLDAQKFAATLHALNGEAERAADELSESVPVSMEHPTWPTFRRAHDFRVANERLWEWMYDTLCDSRTAQAREEDRAARKRAGNAMGGVLGAMTSVGNIPVRPHQVQLPIPAPSTGAFAKDALEAAVETQQSTLRALQQERTLSEETWAAARQPEGFNLALRVLTAMAVAGLVVPVILLVMGFERTPWWVTAAAGLLFTLGLALLLRFLFVYAQFLHADGRGDLPTRLRGLLTRNR